MCGAALVTLVVLASPASAQDRRDGVAAPDPGTGDEADRALADRVVRALSAVEGVTDLRVEVRAGVVRIEGHAASPGARTAAREIASAMPGTVYVLNELTIPERGGGVLEAHSSPRDQATEERLRGMLAEIEALREVRVRVRSGIVRLDGPVPSRDAQRAAVALASGLEGVAYVDDRTVEARRLSDRLVDRVRELRRRAERAVAMLPQVLVALGVLAAFAWIGGVVRRSDAWLRPFTQRRLLRGIVRRVVGLVVFAIGLFLAMEIVGLTSVVGAVLGTAGVVGIVLGLAFRDIAENYLASILLGVRRPFSTKDHVRIGEHEGRVVRLTTRDTVLLTLDGHHVRLPNALVYKSVIVNYTSNGMRRLCVTVGASARAELARIQRAGLDALAATPGVLADPAAFVRYDALDESDLELRFHAWVDQQTNDWAKVRSEAVRRVRRACDGAGAEVPPKKHHVELARAAATALDGDAPRSEDAVAHEVEIDDVLERQIDRAAPQDRENLLSSDERDGEPAPRSRA